MQPRRQSRSAERVSSDARLLQWRAPSACHTAPAAASCQPWGPVPSTSTASLRTSSSVSSQARPPKVLARLAAAPNRPAVARARTLSGAALRLHWSKESSTRVVVYTHEVWCWRTGPPLRPTEANGRSRKLGERTRLLRAWSHCRALASGTLCGRRRGPQQGMVSSAGGDQGVACCCFWSAVPRRNAAHTKTRPGGSLRRRRASDQPKQATFEVEGSRSSRQGVSLQHPSRGRRAWHGCRGEGAVSALKCSPSRHW